MTLYEKWMKDAYTQDGRINEQIWQDYLPREQKIYETILSESISVIEGKLSELCQRFDMTPEYMVAFIDGINEVLPAPYNMEEITEDSDIKLVIDFATLYKKMVEYKAEHLYTLPQWDLIFDKERQKELYTEQKKSRTIVKGEKVGRNDPCPCGSGKKYKKCCGA